jgi:hypothetical protein
MSSFSPYSRCTVCVFLFSQRAVSGVVSGETNSGEALIDLAFSNSPHHHEREIKRSGLGPKVHKTGGGGVFHIARCQLHGNKCCIKCIRVSSRKTGSEQGLAKLNNLFLL